MEDKTRKNNLYTASYFKKRMRESGIKADIIVPRYPANDRRYWTMLIDSDLCIVCTCFKYVDPEQNRMVVLFKFSDGGQVIRLDKTIETLSMNIITEYVTALKCKKTAANELTN